MSLLETYFAHPKEKDAVPIAIIPLLKPPILLLEPLADHPLWQWSTQYAKAENIRPIIVTDNSAIRAQCMPLGIDVLLVPKRTSIVNAITTVLDTFPNTCFFMMDAYYPIRARGIMRTLLAQYYLQPHPSSIIAPGLSLHDSTVFRATHELKFKSTSVTVKFPKFAAAPIKTSKERAALENVLSQPTMQSYDPWFSPSTIAVINGALPFPRNYTDKLQNCALYVCAFPFSGVTHPAALPYHNYIYTVEEDFRTKNVDPAVHYILCPNTTTETTGWDISTWNNPFFPGSLLTPFAKCLALLHHFYPDAKLLYDLFVVPLSQKEEEYNHELRERAVIFEKIFSDNTHCHRCFVNLSKPQKEPEKPAEPRASIKDIATILYENDNTLDYSQYAVIHVAHNFWVDRLILDRQFATGMRLATKDKFTYTWNPDDVLHISWTRWGAEDFVRESNTNVWKLAAKTN